MTTSKSSKTKSNKQKIKEVLSRLDKENAWDARLEEFRMLWKQELETQMQKLSQEYVKSAMEDLRNGYKDKAVKSKNPASSE